MRLFLADLDLLGFGRKRWRIFLGRPDRVIEGQIDFVIADLFRLMSQRDFRRSARKRRHPASSL